MKIGRFGLIAFCGVLVMASGSVVGHAKYAPEASQQQMHETTITIDNFSFMPHDITVSAGTTVVWLNHDDVPHTVVSTDGIFKSKALDTDDKFAFTFKDAGTFEYYCSVHPKMTAKVIVK